MIIALFPNMNKNSSQSYAAGITEFLKKNNVKVIAEDNIASSFGADPLSSVHPNMINFSISMGGDGTILRLVHRHPEIEAPILGINMGSLGFLADIPLSDIYPSIQDLLNGSYHIQHRMMMEGRSMNNDLRLAVNEMAVHRAQNPTLVEVSIHVDGTYVNTFAADGVIISTPSGSTAYSLSAGGPILTPNLEAFVITPISPHTISNRPIVLMPEHEIQVQYLSEHHPIEVSFDGVAGFHLAPHEVCHLSKAKRKFSLVHLSHHDYYSTLRSKLGWTGKLKVS